MSFRLEHLAQGGVVLDDAVVHDREAAGAVEMGMRVAIARRAVRGPARVRDAEAAGERAAVEALLRQFDGFTLDRTDGLRFADARSWVHIRPSGTEPIVRIIAEAQDGASADALLSRARKAFAV